MTTVALKALGKLRVEDAGDGTFLLRVSTDASDAFGAGTREHGQLKRVEVGEASARDTLPALGASREIYVMASARCFFCTGNNTITVAADTGHPLAADERFYLRVPAGHTHIAFIQDQAGGNLTVCAVT